MPVLVKGFSDSRCSKRLFKPLLYTNAMIFKVFELLNYNPFQHSCWGTSGNTSASIVVYLESPRRRCEPNLSQNTMVKHRAQFTKNPGRVTEAKAHQAEAQLNYEAQGPVHQESGPCNPGQGPASQSTTIKPSPQANAQPSTRRRWTRFGGGGGGRRMTKEQTEPESRGEEKYGSWLLF